MSRSITIQTFNLLLIIWLMFNHNIFYYRKQGHFQKQVQERTMVLLWRRQIVQCCRTVHRWKQKLTEKLKSEFRENKQICNNANMLQPVSNIIMTHSSLWRHIVLLTVCVYSSNHRELYTIGISMTRRFRKSVGPSVCLSVCNANKKSLLLHYWQ